MNLPRWTAAVAAVALLAACTPGTGPDERPSTDPTAQPTAAPSGPTKVEVDESTINVVMDGWSLTAARANGPLTVRVDGRSRPVSFNPVDGDGLVALASDYPQVIEAAVARMVDAATAVACDAYGCVVGDPLEPGADTSDDGELCARNVCLSDGYRIDHDTLAGFTDASTIPALGEVYAAWGVESLLHVAAVEGPAGATVELVRGDASFPVGTIGAARDEVADSDGERPSGQLSDVVGAGFGDDVRLVSFGLGHLFTPRPQWWDVPDAPYVHDLTVRTAGVEATAKFFGGAPMTGGVGSTIVPAESLTDGQLTYATSPTTGCSIGVVCLPVREIPGEVDVVAAKVVEVCDADDFPTSAVASDVVITLDLGDRAIHQAGMWDGKSRADFGSKTAGRFSGQPITTSGDLTIRALGLYVQQAGAVLTDTTGSVWQVGVDDPQFAEQPFDADRIVAESYWARCG